VRAGAESRYCGTEQKIVQPVVTGKIRRGRRLVTDEFDVARYATWRRVKAVLIGPYTLAHHAAIAGGPYRDATALAHALSQCAGESLDPAELAERSRATEVEELGVAGGRQDHYASAFGGALALRFSERNTDVRQIRLTREAREELERRCLIVYTGESRISGDTIAAVTSAYERRDAKVLGALLRMRQLAEDMARALEHADVDGLASLVGEHWAHQRSLHPAIPTNRIDAIIEQARIAGAIGAKALGASGGGCVLVIAGRGRESTVANAVSALGPLLPFRIAMRGVETTDLKSATELAAP
jgi:D-glycero-alpha-D-manno-heptose-7-phosphate kinase